MSSLIAHSAEKSFLDLPTAWLVWMLHPGRAAPRSRMSYLISGEATTIFVISYFFSLCELTAHIRSTNFLSPTRKRFSRKEKKLGGEEGNCL